MENQSFPLAMEAHSTKDSLDTPHTTEPTHESNTTPEPSFPAESTTNSEPISTTESLTPTETPSTSESHSTSATTQTSESSQTTESPPTTELPSTTETFFTTEHTIAPQQTPEAAPASGFSPGTAVIYALHGKCTIVSIEQRQIGNESIPFYKLEIQRATLSRSTRQDPVIWLPVSSAKERGLRKPMNREEAEAVLAILANEEYYFPLDKPWNEIHPKLEACIRQEGATGLAKVASFLVVYKNRQLIPPTEIIRFDETITKLLLRELSWALGEHIRSLEERITKGFRQKLALYA